MPQKRLLYYQTAAGKYPFEEWLQGLRDHASRDRIHIRLARAAAGNLGDCKPVGEGVSELRLAFGPGYRIYFAMRGEDALVLLIGGDKGSQAKDIAAAHAYWADFQARNRG